ncbi:hypoxanthine phosphoribosyltransferase [Candidatus Endomicrobiellum devescovinae]|jgi:hypoxanthine phosphoribosyltransferase|uniref:hypoxanthine phosphoribosyltransferase n=1 Tax=Candidatus Endomicrobiellum devescovinae TaxID=3242322 RepID=UPI0028273925|nr:hypoxanthine phosphoribosyltransferase [Endomicrobium sp.]
MTGKQYSYNNVDVLISAEDIRKKVLEVGAQISRDYEGKNVLIIAVLNGSFIFCADLVRSLDLECKVDFISVSSYIGTQTQGNVKVISGIKEDIIGKDVVIIEDIVDRGFTLDFLIKEISLKKPKSIKTCVFLDKKCAREKEVAVDYSCFEIGNDFVVGYGLDYNGFFRQLPYVGKIKE